MPPRFDLSQESLGEGIDEPLFQGIMLPNSKQTYWENGENWIAYFRDYDPEQGLSGIPWLTHCREWIEKNLNLPRPRFRSMSWVRIVKRPGGEEQYTVPFPVGTPAVISSNGRKLACGTTDGGVAVFNLDPLPRWPFVVLACAATCGLIILLGRRKKAGSIVNVSN